MRQSAAHLCSDKYKLVFDNPVIKFRCSPGVELVFYRLRCILCRLIRTNSRNR